MRVRSLLPLVALAATVVAVGCGPNGTAVKLEGKGDSPAPVGTDAQQPADVGSPLYAAAKIPDIAVLDRAGAEPLVIPGATVQFENRQMISAEVDGKIDLIAVKPQLLPKGTYLVEGSPTPPADGSSWRVVVFDSIRVVPGVTVVNNVPQKNGAALPHLAADTLVYDRKPDGSLILIPGEIFHGGQYILEWRKETRSVVPYDPQKKYDGVVVLKVDGRDIPHRVKLGRNNKPVTDVEGKEVYVALEQWPDNSLIAKRNPDGSLVMADPAASFPKLVLHPNDDGKKVLYRRISDGDIVTAGQVVCYLDASLILNKQEAALKTKEASEEVRIAATKGVQLSQDKLELTRKTAEGGVAAKVEIINDTLTMTRFQENLAQAIQSIAKAEAEYNEAGEMLRKHRLRSYLNGTVKAVAKRQGETAKVGERVMDIEGFDTVRLEGQLDVQYAGFVTRGDKVTVEPAVPSAPAYNHSWHRQEVTGVAVTGHPKTPLVVSVSADGSVRVWAPFPSETSLPPAASLPHPGVPVRSVACTPPGYKVNGKEKYLVATGADDGKVRIWDLTDPAKVPTAPLAEAAETHKSAVGALAFSPNGEYLASAAGRDVAVWKTATGEKLYDLPTEHRDVVTSLSFTPQATLVTVSKDRTIKVWKLGAERAASEPRPIDHRSGAVDVLGVSPDGGQILFDQDRTRIDVVNLSDKQTAGQLQNMGSTAAFATVALFSPKYNRPGAKASEYIATAGGEGELKGVLQVWGRPAAGGRGNELARLITPARMGVTAAAWSQSAERPFLVAGTEKGTVHIWTPPPADQPKHEGTVMNVDFTDPRYATVRVELDNRALNLPDRSAATIIINPGR